MRRNWIGVALAVVVVLAACGWLLSGWALGTCGAWDRWTGKSGCVARFTVADLRPLGFRSMVPVDSGHVRLFGLTDRGDALVPVQLVVDTATGAQSGRQDLPLTLAHYAIVPSQTGQKVAVICIADDACDQANPKGYVLSVADGSVLEPLPDGDFFGWHFPGERPQTVFAGAWLSDTVSAEPDLTDGSIVLRNPDRQEIGHFSPPVPGGHAAGPSALAVRVSPSGKYLALIDSARVGLSRIDIYEVASKRLLNTITTDADRKVDTNGVWLPDDEHLVLFQDWAAIPSGQRGKSTELYVFKVR